MSDMLITFARSNRPIGRAIPAWPVYDLERRRTLLIDATSRVADDPRGDERRLFAVVPYVQPGT